MKCFESTDRNRVVRVQVSMRECAYPVIGWGKHFFLAALAGRKIKGVCNEKKAARLFPFVLEGSLELCVRLKTFRVKAAGGRDGVPPFNSREGPCPVRGVSSLNRQRGVLHEKRQRPQSMKNAKGRGPCLFSSSKQEDSLRSEGRQGIETDAEGKKAKSRGLLGLPCSPAGKAAGRLSENEKERRGQERLFCGGSPKVGGRQEPVTVSA